MVFGVRAGLRLVFEDKMHFLAGLYGELCLGKLEFVADGFDDDLLRCIVRRTAEGRWQVPKPLCGTRRVFRVESFS